MRALLLLAVLTVGCKSKKEAAPAPPPARDASVDEAPPPEPEMVMTLDEPPEAFRNLSLPARRGACAPTCKRPDGDWRELAPGVAFSTYCHHLNCIATDVIIDCCAPFDPKDSRAVTLALGWADADAAGRAQIALAYVAMMTHGAETPQVTTEGDVIRISLWELVFHSMSRKSRVHTEWTFGVDGSATQKTLESVAVPDDPQLAREQAREAARKAGILQDAAPAP